MPCRWNATSRFSSTRRTALSRRRSSSSRPTSPTPAIYDEAEKDFEAWWERWAKELDWFEPSETVLEWNPPWAKWFQEGKLNVSHNCLDRHVEAGKGDKIAYHWVGEEPARRAT